MVNRHGSGSKYVSRLRFQTWRVNAGKRGLVWQITEADIDALWEAQGGRCRFTGLQLGDDASLDRIDNDLGYFVGNVQLVGRALNMAKGSMTDEQFIELCRAVVANQ
jgi:hypothetical protein